MTRLLDLWTYLAGLEPHEATVLAAYTTGHKRYLPEVLAIVERESRGHAVGVHTGHAPSGRRSGCVFWRRAVDRGLLHLGECEHHTPGDDGCAKWGIAGAHGLAAAYSVHHLGACVAGEAVLVPYLSAVMTFARLRTLERRYGLHTVEARAGAWVRGVGRQGLDG